MRIHIEVSVQESPYSWKKLATQEIELDAPPAVLETVAPSLGPSVQAMIEKAIFDAQVALQAGETADEA